MVMNMDATITALNTNPDALLTATTLVDGSPVVTHAHALASTEGTDRVALAWIDVPGRERLVYVVEPGGRTQRGYVLRVVLGDNGKALACSEARVLDLAPSVFAVLRKVATAALGLVS